MYGNYSPEDRLKAFEYIQMSLLLRVRGFYLLNKQEKNYHKIGWIAEMAALQIVAHRKCKGNAFIEEKMIKNCPAFYYYHCYLSILALLSIEIIDSLGSLSCR